MSNWPSGSSLADNWFTVERTGTHSKVFRNGGIPRVIHTRCRQIIFSKKWELNPEQPTASTPMVKDPYRLYGSTQKIIRLKQTTASSSSRPYKSDTELLRV